MNRKGGHVRNLLDSIARATAAQVIGRSVNVILAFCVLWVMRPGAYTDAFFLMISIAFYGYGTVSNTLADATVPLLRNERDAPSPRAQRALAGIGALVFVGVWFLVTDAVRFDNAWLALGGGLMVYGGLASSFAVARLHYDSRYSAPGLTWLFRLPPLVLFVVYAKQPLSLSFLALGLGVADMARYVYLSRLAGPTEKTAKSSVRLLSSKAVASHYVALVFASSVSGLNPVIDRWIVSLGKAGGISLLDIGERLFGIVGTISAVGIASVSLVAMTRELRLTNTARAWYRLLGLTALLGAVWTGVALVAGWVVLPVLFDHWLSFGQDEQAIASAVYRNYVYGLIPFLVGVVCVRRFMVQKARGWLVVLAVVSAGSNLVLSYALFVRSGVAGVALATTLVYYLTATIMIAVFHWRHLPGRPEEAAG